jgi:tape measure domain-containing protein
MTTKINQLLMFSLGLNADEALKTARLFQREMASAARATKPLGDQLKALEVVSKEYSLSAEQTRIIEARLTAQHAARTAKVNEQIAALDRLKAAQSRVDSSGGLGIMRSEGVASGSGGRSVSGMDYGGGKSTPTSQIAEIRAAIDGWREGLRAVGTSANAVDHAKSVAGAKAWADGLATVEARTKAAAQAARDAQAALSGWANGLKTLAASPTTISGNTARDGRSAWEAGLLVLRAQSDAKRDAYNDNLKDGIKYMEQFQTSQQRMKAQLLEARQMFDKGAISVDQYRHAVHRIHQEHSVLFRSFAQLKAAVSTLLGPLVLVYTAFRAFTGSIKLTAELDAAEAKFRVFTGSAKEAAKILKDIRDLSTTSPVSFEGGQRAVTTMLQYGVAGRDVTKMMRQIAEITGGNTDRMESLALAVGQASGASRLMGQELLQMVNAGFNPLKVISEQTGESMASLKQRMQDGEVSFEMVAKTLADATSEGGRFNGLLKEMSETTAGKLVKARSELEKLGIAFGNAFKPEIEKAIDFLTSSLASLGTMFDKINKANKDSYDRAYKNNTLFGSSGSEQDEKALQWVGTGIRSAKQAGDLAKQVQLENERAAIIKRMVDHGYETKQLSQQEIANAVKLATQLEEVANIRKRVADGKGSAADQAFVDRLNAAAAYQERNQKNADRVTADQAYAEYASTTEGYGTQKGKQELIDYVEKVGQGYLTDAGLAIYKQFVEELDKINAAEKERLRVQEAFNDAQKGAAGDLTEARYGKDQAENIKLLQENATGEEREDLNELIAKGATYKEIFDNANAEAQAQVRSLDAIRAKTKAINDAAAAQKEAADKAKKDAEEQLKLEEKRGKERDKNREKTLKDLEKDAAAYRKSLNPFADFIDKMSDLYLMLDQGVINQGEFDGMRNNLLNEGTKNVSATAAPVINKGSQEAFQYATGQTVDKITKQLQETERQTLLQTTLVEVQGETNRKLDDLISGAPGVLGP